MSVRRAVLAALVAGVSIAGTISTIGSPSSALDLLGGDTTTSVPDSTSTTVTTLPPDNSTTT
ncbi:MAG TPA: hypothetical protein VHL53_02455, partial [Acidimicrobiia bacterium]|nr:hypothetical protein [Acidimicrobiia bacterium]